MTLAPQLAFKNHSGRELIFMVDRSGSMRGQSIQWAKRALHLFFRSLPEECYVNIIGFGSSHEPLWPASVRYTDRVMDRATRCIEALAADLGGTEICAPLRAMLPQPKIHGYERQLFVLTDGQVANAAETIAVVQRSIRACPTTRVFALGLGHGASHELVEGIAEAGHGTAAFCVAEETLREKVIEQLNQALQPSLIDVTVEWEGAIGAPPTYSVAPRPSAPPPAETAEHAAGLLEAFSPPSVGSLLRFTEVGADGSGNPAGLFGLARAPFAPPPVHSGERFLSYCMVPKGGKPPVAVRVTAMSPAGPLDVRIEVTPADMVQGTLVHTLAAKALIADLERGRSWLHRGTGSTAAAPLRAMHREMVRLGTTFSLASRCTSFVAVQAASSLESMHHHIDVAPQPMQNATSRMASSVDINLACASYSKGGGSCCGGGPPPSSRPPRKQPPVRAAVPKGKAVDPASRAAQTSRLDQLVQLQSSAGFFTVSAELCALAGCGLNDLTTQAALVGDDSRVLATAVALTIMAALLLDLKAEWVLIERKALAWLANASSDTADALRIAKRLVVAA